MYRGLFEIKNISRRVNESCLNDFNARIVIFADFYVKESKSMLLLQKDATHPLLTFTLSQVGKMG